MTVTLYDDVGLIPSYWMLGFRRLAEAGKIKLRYRHGRRAAIPHEERKWKSTLFEVSHGTQTRLAIVDIFDRYISLNEDVLDKVDTYFKFNFNPVYIAESVPRYQSKIHPTGFYFPVRVEKDLVAKIAYPGQLLAGFQARKTAKLKERISDAIMCLQEFRTLQSKHLFLGDYTEVLRGHQPVRYDLYWNVNCWHKKFDDVYNATTTNLQRQAMMEKLQEVSHQNPELRMAFGFIDNEESRARYAKFILNPSPPTREYLNTLSHSRVSIVSRGLYGCFSWRIGEQLAMGRLAFVERPLNTTYAPLIDGTHAVFFEENLDGFEEKLTYYLNHPDSCEKIARNGQAYFDEYHLPEVQAKYMLDVVQRA